MKLTYRISGMHCASCIEKIKSGLSAHIHVVNVTLNPPQLVIEAEKAPSLEQLNQWIALTGSYQLEMMTDDQMKNPKNRFAYYPIFLIAIYILGVASINNFHVSQMNWQTWMNQIMGGFFLVFSAFKFLDLRGFAEGYATYDLLARRWSSYGLIYPFLELGLGILYLGFWWPMTTQILTIVIMGFSSLGVINSLLKKQKIKCACLGTILNVPLSSITLIEDLAMVILSALSLVMR